MATFTPISHWLAMPLAELCEWQETVASAQKADAGGGG